MLLLASAQSSTFLGFAKKRIKEKNCEKIVFVGTFFPDPNDVEKKVS